MPDSMYYVMLSRVSASENVFNENFSPEKLKANSDALEANEDLNKRDITPSFRKMKFSFFVLNVSSLSKHYVDLKDDMFALRSDYVCIVETWIDPEKENIARYNIPDRSFKHASYGKGKGCAIYSHTSKRTSNGEVSGVILHRWPISALVCLLIKQMS